VISGINAICGDFLVSDVTYRHFVMLEEGLPELKLVCLKAEDDDG
jgi:hypothetical protein